MACLWIFSNICCECIGRRLCMSTEAHAESSIKMLESNKIDEHDMYKYRRKNLSRTNEYWLAYEAYSVFVNRYPLDVNLYEFMCIWLNFGGICWQINLGLRCGMDVFFFKNVSAKNPACWVNGGKMYSKRILAHPQKSPWKFQRILTLRSPDRAIQSLPIVHVN